MNEQQALETEALPPQMARPRIWTCFVYPLIGVILAVVSQIILVAALMLSGQVGDLFGETPGAKNIGEQLTERIMMPDMFMVMLVCGQLSFAVATLAPAYFANEPWKERFGYRAVKQPLKVYGYTLLSSIFVLAVSIGLVYLVTLVIAPDEQLLKLFENMTPGWGVIFVLGIALLPGFIEETLFRGYIQQRFLTRWSPALSIAASSILFALVHISPHAIAVALPLGIWFGIIAWKTKSILPTIACHAFVNGGLNTWRLICKFCAVSDSTANYFHVAFVAIGFVGFLLACRLLYSMPVTQQTNRTRELT